MKIWTKNLSKNKTGLISQVNSSTSISDTVELETWNKGRCHGFPLTTVTVSWSSGSDTTSMCNQHWFTISWQKESLMFLHEVCPV
jgi:hypothetical protein